MTDRPPDTVLVGAAIPIGAGLGGAISILFGGTLVYGAFAGIAVGILTAAIILQAVDALDVDLANPRERIALGATTGAIVAIPVGLTATWGHPSILWGIGIAAVAGALLGGFLGGIHPEPETSAHTRL